MQQLIGPFKQILTLAGLPMKGAITDDQLQIIPDGGVWIEDGIIIAVDSFEKLRKEYPTNESIWEIKEDHVLLPGFIDCHTHMCFAGDRSKDYAMRIAGKSYLEIAKAGGGIWDSVTQTRAASSTDLVTLLTERARAHSGQGITTMEVKSGYGLDTQSELKMLKAIADVAANTRMNLISTCLAAHIVPRDFNGSQQEYLEYILSDLLPIVKNKGLANRVDIFIEESAFTTDAALYYLKRVKQMGFDITVHADQFTTGGSDVAVTVGALSADHLEASTEKEIKLLAASKTVAVALPGASIGLGMDFAPARKLLDAGASLAIASDWNPGSAPMGDLLMQAAVLSTYEKLTTAEVFAGLTFRAAKALNLTDRGTLQKGKLADMQAYPCEDYREILYHQGKLKPSQVWKSGTPMPNDLMTNTQ
jgi:imidazolonepropionase